MQNSNALTVVIPTYCRPNSACSLAEKLIEESLRSQFSIVFVDDSSSVNMYRQLVKISDSSLDMKVVVNDHNIGFAASLRRGIKAAETDWVMPMADDDRIVPGSIGRLLEFLSSTEFDFVAPQYIGLDKLYRDGGRTGPIRPSEFRYAANLAPGLVFRHEVWAQLDAFIVRLLEEESDAATTYPQAFVAANCIARRKATWLAFPTVAQGENLPSGIKDSQGRHYADPLARIAQAISFDSGLRELSERPESSPHYARRVRSLVHYNSSILVNALSDLLSSLSHQNIDGRRLLLASVLGPSIAARRIAARLRAQAGRARGAGSAKTNRRGDSSVRP